MATKLNALEKVFVTQLKDIYSAETQLVKALPKMAQAASNDQLKQAFEDHLEETRGQVERLDTIFSALTQGPGGHKCKAMEGLIAEGEEVIKDIDEPEARDAALICAAQKVEHYEIATYGTLREYARILGNKDAQNLLSQTLEEEGNADKKLTKLAEESINERALQSAR